MLSYKILKKEKFLDFRVSYDVEVEPIDHRLPTTGELAEIAAKLQSKKHQKMFICFYLPGMQLDAGAFATGHSTRTIEPKVQFTQMVLPERYQYYRIVEVMGGA